MKNFLFIYFFILYAKNVYLCLHDYFLYLYYNICFFFIKFIFIFILEIFYCLFFLLVLLPNILYIKNL